MCHRGILDSVIDILLQVHLFDTVEH